MDAEEIALDIHHIFPRDWCEKQGIGKDRYDSVLNKTPISYKANRKIGGDAPSRYVPRLQGEKEVALNDSKMDELLASHALTPDLLRRDAFEDFTEDRRRRLSRASSRWPWESRSFTYPRRRTMTSAVRRTGFDRSRLDKVSEKASPASDLLGLPTGFETGRS